MKQTDQTLLEQMRITEFDVEHRKSLIGFTHADAKALLTCKSTIELAIDALVSEFYESQTSIAEIALLIGDADTLSRLRSAQRRYVLDLFTGLYDLEYVNNRLRIGLVHKRIGVESKLYLSAIHTLTGLLNKTILAALPSGSERDAVLSALNKLLMFDVTLVFETYIRSLVSEIETAKNKAEQYAASLEEKVRERTQQLEELSRTDSLTGLLNVRYLEEIFTRTLRSAQRRAEPVTVVYMDINEFKKINDAEGHLRGDEILRAVGAAIKSIARSDDSCFRYGGDEFCVILNNCHANEAQQNFVARLNAMIKERVGDVSLSCGVAQTGPDEYAGATTLIHQADERMYAAKQSMKAADGPLAA
jgi:diguanylate cyclase (GGDEF)-like protein